MQHPSTLLKAINGKTLFWSDGEEQSITIAPEDREEAVQMIDLLSPLDVTILSSIAGGAGQNETAKIVGIRQPSLHYRLGFLVRWFRWCPRRRRALLSIPRLHPYSGGGLSRHPQPVDLRKAWDEIIWQHRPLLRVVPIVGAVSQGQLRHQWTAWLEELLLREHWPAATLSAIRDVLKHPVWWRRPATMEERTTHP